MEKQIVKTEHAPAPIGPYSQAVKTGNLLFISGQVASVPATGELITDHISEETHQVMKNLKAILTEAGLTFSHVVKTTVFLSDMSLFADMNEIYGQYFAAEAGAGSFPARETIAVKALPKNANVEISMIASL